jgi:hypothetical protein
MLEKRAVEYTDLWAQRQNKKSLGLKSTVDGFPLTRKPEISGNLKGENQI